jgi:hypothetical protein
MNGASADPLGEDKQGANSDHDHNEGDEPPLAARLHVAISSLTNPGRLMRVS